MKSTKDKIQTIDTTLSLLCKHYNIYGAEEPISRGLKNQVFFLNHGNALSWMVVPSALSRYCYDNEHPDFKLGVIYHPLVKKIPVLNKLAANLAGIMPNSHLEIVRNLKNGHVDAYGTMPEAINCMFKFQDPISKFRYNGLILGALDAGSDMFLIVHKGTEKWDKKMPVINRLPLPAHPHLPLPIGKVELEMAIVPYSPQITKSEFKDYHKKYKGMIKQDFSPIDEEGVRMRRVMLETYKNL